MYFDVEFTVADLRPLERQEKGLLPFLLPLHRMNDTLKVAKNQPAPYYRSVGSLNTWVDSGPSYFKAANAVKIPCFEEHTIPLYKEISPDKAGSSAVIHRYNHVRRYFTSAYYGVQNGFRLGFGCQLGGVSNIPDNKLAFDVLKFLFSLPVKVYGGKEERRLGELGDWLAAVVRRGTTFEQETGSSLFERLFGCTPEQEAGKVVFAGIVCRYYSAVGMPGVRIEIVSPRCQTGV